MCKLTDKPIYASGFGIQLLANFCSVGIRKMTVINGNEKGCDLKQMYRYEAGNYSGD